MRPIANLTLCIAPLIAIFMYLYFKNRSYSGFSRLQLFSFLGGGAGVLVLVASQAISYRMGLDDLGSLKRTIFYSFVTIGGSAELGKFIILRYFIVKKNLVAKPIDIINFSIMTSLGFSTLALLFFVCNLFNIQTHFPPTLYAFIFVPANILFSVIMGFFVGMARFLKVRFVYSLTGLVGAVFFHGIFNFCLLTSDFKLLSLFSFGSTIIVLVLGMKAAVSLPERSN
ncbi:MAG: PrsW family glutamic-type intramembrane protease [Bacteroidota bacterium]